MTHRLSVGVEAALLSMAAITAASAAPGGTTSVFKGSGLRSCATGYVCLYEHPRYNQDGGYILETNEDIENLGTKAAKFDRETKAAEFNDKASSVYNNTTDRIVRLYPYYSFIGVPLTVLPGESFAFDNDNNKESDWYDNRYSSLKLEPYGGGGRG
ncbi:peptidase inhibitor family I36 protein [Streptomyces flaveolus]|uniref:peptidase inhibitor family I36 protein n=1 Tax=Streptomyces flaveolus TaxID=67297 RepID=UPI00343202B0